MRTVYVLRAIERMTADEAAQALDLAPATVRERFLHAQRRVRRAFVHDFEIGLAYAFSFAGARCDRIVAGVLGRPEDLPPGRSRSFAHLFKRSTAMSFLIPANAPNILEARRAFLGKSGLLLSGAAVSLLAGQEALAAGGDKSANSDARILNTALGTELEAITAYQVGAGSGLLQKPVLDLAVTFQGHHKENADLRSKRSRSSAASPWLRNPSTRSRQKR